eukprot:TRINITY_DN6933_c0_g1_i1.p1 TRINITY_DN6933_c0_g1~~TRINITY_DN6933_c0_g1_i1.p1  ORF type:complete len:445 (-),score=47.68 TRINITY_DN6933_c0_g1_i1:50-1384(-)
MASNTRDSILGANKARVEQLLTFGKAAATKKDYEKATTYFTEAIARAPDLYRSYLLRATMYASMNNLTGAQEDLKNFIQKEPNFPKTDPIYSGFLKKKNPRKKGSEKRYFYLKNKFLWYYKNPTDEIPIHCICLENASILDKHKKNKFQICVPGRIYKLKTKENNEKLEWLKFLNKAVTTSVNDIEIFLTDMDRRSSLSSRAICEGYLYKRGNKNKGWRLRWFSLKGNFLTYSTSPSDAKPSGVIDLNTMSNPPQSPMDEDSESKFYFQIYTFNRTYFLYADRIEDRAKWLTVLTRPPSKPETKPKGTEIQKRETPPTSLKPTVPKRITTNETSVEPVPKTLPENPRASSSFIRVSDKRHSAIEVQDFTQPSEVETSKRSSIIEDDLSREQKRNAEALKKSRRKAYISSGLVDLSEPLMEEEHSEMGIQEEKRKNDCCGKCTVI